MSHPHKFEASAYLTVMMRELAAMARHSFDLTVRRILEHQNSGDSCLLFKGRCPPPRA